MLKVIHNPVKGRTRFRIRGLYKGERLKQYLEDVLNSNGVITEVKASVRTGNLLVKYNSDATQKTISAYLQNELEKFYNGHPLPVSSSLQTSIKAKQTEKQIRPTPTPKENCAALKIKKEPTKPRTVVEAQFSPSDTLPTVSSSLHTQSAPSVLKKYDVDIGQGLVITEARNRLDTYGPNKLPEPKSRSSWDILKEQFCSGPVAMLSVAAGVSILTGGLIDAAAIMAVVGLNAIIGYVTESQSERTINSLKNMVTPSATVLRGGEIHVIDVKNLVPGDILFLRPGDYVGADARIVESTRLSIDESALTGESIPVGKKTTPLDDKNAILADRNNMCYRGTLVTGGQGMGVVVSTGAKTEIGRIQQLVEEAESPDTPMSQQLDNMGEQMVWISSGMCSLVFLIGMLRGTGFLNMLTTSISLAVAAVPEGLPAVATTALALGIRRMETRGVLIRHLGAIEALGSTQVICFDKTGTITANKMAIIQICAGRANIQYNPTIPIKTNNSGEFFSHELSILAIAVSLCSEIEVIAKDTQLIVTGSPTEKALAQLSIDSGIDLQKLKKEFVTRKIYHRSENRNFMVSLHDSRDGKSILAVKGSPSEVLDLCSHWMVEGELELLTDDKRLELQIDNERMAGESLRVLGTAVCLDAKSVDENDLDSLLDVEYVWIGMVGMTDPIRSGVPELMQRFQDAGIKTVMITGDQLATAYTVGNQIGLSGQDRLQILEPSSFSSMSQESLAALCDKINVFARVSPANKLQIVEAYQGTGNVVAMTGDGINDGPALKKADIGVAMGRSGTDVAREISDVVLEDDQLETMIVAVEDGRTIYINVRKTLHFLLATNFSEIIVSFAANITGLGQPLTQMQLLWINMITDIFPGLALSLEPAEDKILLQPPRDPEEPILRKQDLKKISLEAGIISAGAMGAYGYGLSRYGVGPQATSLSFLSLTLGQLLHAYHCRSEKHGIFAQNELRPNKYLKWAMGGSFALQAVAMLVPGLRSILGIQKMNLVDSLVVGGTAFAPLLINDLYKKRILHKKETPRTGKR